MVHRTEALGDFQILSLNPENVCPYRAKGTYRCDWGSSEGKIIMDHLGESYLITEVFMGGRQENQSKREGGGKIKD